MPTPSLRPPLSQAPPMISTNPHQAIAFSVPPPNLYPPTGPSLAPSVLGPYPTTQPGQTPYPTPQPGQTYPTPHGVPVWPSPFHTYPAYGYPSYLPHQGQPQAIPNYGMPPPGFAFPPPVAPLRPQHQHQLIPGMPNQPQDGNRMLSEQRDAIRDNSQQRHPPPGDKHSSHDSRDRSSSPRSHGMNVCPQVE